jgi:predicted PolB exonuclease-like 3'-5' exonuclease
MEMKTLIFDIETGPLPEEEIRKQMPLFDPDSVKMGNLKDPSKRAEKLKEAKENYYTEAYSRAALNAWSGQVLAIGYCYTDDMDNVTVLEGEEDYIIEQFAKILAPQYRVAGFNIKGFDLPFLARRAMKHRCLRLDQFLPDGKYYGKGWLDLMEIWQCGNRMEFISLNRLANFLGVDTKDWMVEGKDFYKFFEDPETHHMAIEYLETDVKVTAQIAEIILP